MSPSSHASLRRLAAAIMLLLLPSLASANGVAPLIELRLDVVHWQPQPAGDVASDGDDFDIEEDFGFDRSRTNILEFGLEHPVPVLPNLRLRHWSLDDSETATLERERGFGPITFTESEDVRAAYDLATTDATLYWSPLDNWLELDLGATVRYLDAEVEVENRERDEREQVGGSLVLPLAHVGARANLPLTGLYVRGEINTLRAGGNALQDVRAGVGWEATRVFGVEAGYQRFSVELDDIDDLDADIDLGGPYVAARLRF